MEMFRGVAISSENFAEFVKTTPTHLFRVSGYYTVNTAGWHAAHILDAKDGDVDWRSVRLGQGGGMPTGAISAEAVADAGVS